MGLSLIGINHNTAPVEVRECVTFDSHAITEHLLSLKKYANLTEIAILATCNRTEIYYTFDCQCHSDNQVCDGLCLRRSQIKSLIIDYMTQYSELEKHNIASYIYEYDGHQMVQHAMRVASGLNSMIIGEPQILGQMKQCFQTALRAGTMKGALFRLFQSIFSSAKKVRSETGIGNEPISIAYTAVKLIAQFYSSLENKKVLFIGAGDTIRLVSQHIGSLSCRDYIVANRSAEHALDLVQGDSKRVIALDQLGDYLIQADVVVSCTSSVQRIMNAEQVKTVMAARANQRLLLIDLAIPRDIDPIVEKISQVYLYSIDDLSNIVQSSLVNRRQKIQQADRIIADHQHKFMQWLNLQNGVEVISALRQQGEQSMHNLVQKYMNKVHHGEEFEASFKQFSEQLKNALLHSPTVALREAIEKDDKDKVRLIREVYRI